MVWYWGVGAEFNAGSGMKGGTQSTHAFIQKTFTEHQLYASTVPGAEDRAVDTPGRKEGKQGVREGSRKQMDYIPAFRELIGSSGSHTLNIL